MNFINYLIKKIVILMEDRIKYERFLFGEGNEISIDDIEFCVDRIIKLPKIRPFQLEKAVRLSLEYCKLADFRIKLLEKSNECPVLIFQLFKRGGFVFSEIEPFLNNRRTFLLCYYFRKEIVKFENFIGRKNKPNGFDESFFENQDNIDQLIEYGFLPSSIEYYLKYDMIDDFLKADNEYQKPKWSPFEWSLEPQNLDLLSFAGFFGSIKCFKHLMMKGFRINDQVISMVVCSGCLDLYHLCNGQQSVIPQHVYNATEFFYIPLLSFMIENGADINTGYENNLTLLHLAAENGHLSVVEYLVNQKADINAYTKDVERLYLWRLLFILQRDMVILVLLNI